MRPTPPSALFPTRRSSDLTWLPKLSDHAVVLLHGINGREQEFGTGRWWEELCKRYPHFSFLHGHGLGVLADRKSTRLNSSHRTISYAVFCLKIKTRDIFST